MKFFFGVFLAALPFAAMIIYMVREIGVKGTLALLLLVLAVVACITVGVILCNI